jgi:hypothetical protein
LAGKYFNVSDDRKVYRKQGFGNHARKTIGRMVRRRLQSPIQTKLRSLAPQVGYELERGLNNVQLMTDKIDQETRTGIVGLQYTVHSLLAFAYVRCEFVLVGSFNEDLIKIP